MTERNRLRGALLDAADRAERQLGRELHDGLGQDLVALSLLARRESFRVQKWDALDVEALGFIETAAVRALESCRTVARGLSALIESNGDLCGALRGLPERFPHRGLPLITVAIEQRAPLGLPMAAREHLYRIAQEGLTNAVKHARAKRITIHLEIDAATVVLTVRDDGIGLPLDSLPVEGVGLASMRHRAAASGGRLRVAGPSGSGTELRLDCPNGTPESRYDLGEIFGETGARDELR